MIGLAEIADHGGNIAVRIGGRRVTRHSWRIEVMYVTVVYVHVKREHLADFIESVRSNHENSVLEPGNLRFDILQSGDDPTSFIFYEAYRDEVAAKAHKETAHYAVWRDKVADWMAEPRKGVRYDGLFPAI
jgi:autoinducer 2-degrading protein